MLSDKNAKYTSKLFVTTILILTVLLLVHAPVVKADIPDIWYCSRTTTETGTIYRVCTEIEDYSPESTVYVRGNGFAADISLQVRVTRPDGSIVTGDGSFAPWPTDYDTVLTDSIGGFNYDYILDGIVGRYYVDVLDASGNVIAAHSFLDDKKVTFNQSGISTNPGAEITIVHYQGLNTTSKNANLNYLSLAGAGTEISGFNDNEVIQIDAYPPSGYTFSQWKGSAAEWALDSATSASTKLHIKNKAGTLTANFVANPAQTCGNNIIEGTEVCDGGACCSASCTYLTSATTCRASGGVCDLAETCSGSSATCPSDVKSTAQCRSAVDQCDVSESCNGVDNTCPADQFRSTETVCRASAGACDVAETCSGSSAACPSDVKSTAECRAANGACDVAESCDGTNNDCPGDAVTPAETVCRASGGVCDLAETCSGSSAACPADAKSTAVCRPTADVCDTSESCDGVSNSCPADSFLSASNVCRTALGACDVADYCTGTSAACPTDAVQPNTFECRGTAGVCDIAENCDGSSKACPTDAFLVAGTVCNAASCSDTTSNLPDTCNGFEASCQDGGTQVCNPYYCSSGSGLCFTSCATNADCQATYFCNIATCTLDTTAPTTTDNIPSTWQTTSFDVTFVCTDIATGCAKVYYTTDGSDPDTLSSFVNAASSWKFNMATDGVYTIKYRGIDVAGNLEDVQTAANKLSIDQTPPVIAGAPTTSANSNGWYKTDVTIHFTCTDIGSGVDSLTSDMTLTGEGAGQSVHGTCVDKAGNSVTFDVTNINIDLTAPSIDGAPTTLPNGNNWYKSDVVVHYTCTDALSDVDTLTGDQTLSAEAANQSTMGTCVDKAGNSADKTVSGINIDKTVPTITAARDRAPNLDNWYNADVTVTFTCGDSLSGVESCTSPTTLVEGASQSAKGDVIDLAGNTATATESGINIDKTAPTISAARDRTPNANDWYNADVTVTFTCGDALSGIASCTSPITFGEGADQSAKGDVTDLAGNTNSVTESNINIDKTVPTISGSRIPVANANGWNNVDVTVQFVCADALSGVKSCTPDTMVSTEEAGQHVLGTVLDKAGNSATFDVTGINIDKTAPSTTDDYSYNNVWINIPAAITLTPTDLLSTVDITTYCVDTSGVCNPDTTYTSGTIGIATEGTNYLRYQSEDKADNLEVVKQTIVKYDNTPPSITINVDPAADYQCGFWKVLWTDDGTVNKDVVHGCSDVSAAVTDSISGVNYYTIKLIDSNNNVVATKTNEKIYQNFETAEKVWKVVVEAYDNAGNYWTISKLLYEDDDNDVAVLNGNGGAPDISDICPAEVPSIDANKDGCQDIPGTQTQSASWCIDTYSGRAATSLNPTTALSAFGTPFNKGSKVWNPVSSKINGGIETSYAVNVVDKQGQSKDEIHCSIDASNLKTSSGTTLTYTKRDSTKFVYKLIKDVLKVKESYHTHELSDGTKINAWLHYDENKDKSSLQVTYNNDDKNKVCDDKAKADRDTCKASCSAKDKTCNKVCDDKFKNSINACRDTYHYTIKQEYVGYKTLSVYDIMKLVGYE